MLKRTFAALLVAALWLGCASAKEQPLPFEAGSVSARLLRIEPVEPTEYKTQVEVVLRVDNPSVDPVRVEEIEIELSFTGDSIVSGEDLPPGMFSDEDESPGADEEPGEPGGGGDGEVEVEVFEGSDSPGKTVGAGQHLDLPVRVLITYPEEPRAFVEFCKLGVANLDVEGVVRTSKGSIGIEDVGEIPTPSLPEPEATEVQVANAGESGSLTMTLRVFNANVFSWKLKDWDYKVFVAGKLMREATVGVGERVQPNTAIQYGVNIPLNQRTFGPEVLKLLKGDAIPYRLEGRLRYGEIAVPTNIEGEVRFSR